MNASSVKRLSKKEFGVCQFSIFIFPYQTGTATSSPTDKAASQSFNIVNVMLGMQRDAYESPTIKKAKLVRGFETAYELKPLSVNKL